MHNNKCAYEWTEYRGKKNVDGRNCVLRVAHGMLCRLVFFFFCVPSYLTLFRRRLSFDHFLQLVQWTHDYCKVSGNLNRCRFILLTTDATHTQTHTDTHTFSKPLNSRGDFHWTFKSLVKHCFWYISSKC